MSERRASGIATVMFTDVEASTDLTTRMGDDAAASLLAAHNTIVLGQVAAYGGRDVRSTGDGFLVFFDSARAAVACALSIQHELSENGHGLRVRIGLSAGEVLDGEGEGERFGAAINLASRVMDRAAGGEILVTDTVRQLVGTLDGSSFHDRGRASLKGFAERQRLYEIQPAETRLARPPAPRGAPGRSRRTWAFVAAASLAVAIAGVVAIVLASGSPDPVSVPPDSVAVIDPHDEIVIDTVPTEENPGPVSAGAGGLWVLNLNSATVTRIDVRTRRVVDTIGIGGTPGNGGAPGNIVASAREVWVSRAACNGEKPGELMHVFTAAGGGIHLTEADNVPLAGAVPGHRTWDNATGGCGLAARGSSVWLATNIPLGLARVDYDAGRSRVVWGRPLPAPDALAVGYGSVWAIDGDRQVIQRIDPDTGRITFELHAGANPVALAVDSHGVWVANAEDNSVSRIDPRTNTVSQAIAVGEGPAAIASGDGAVWVAMTDAGTVSRIDPATNRVTATIAIGHRPQGIAVAGGLVWVTVRS